MLSVWRFLLILLYFSFKDIINQSTTIDVMISESNETINGPFIYGSKKFENIKLVRLDMKQFNNLGGVVGTLSIPLPENSSSVSFDEDETYITTFEAENIVKESKKFNDVVIECSVDRICQSGVFVISTYEIKSVTDITEDVEAFFLLFTHEDIFFPSSTLNIVEYENPLVKCPHYSHWISKNNYLEYRQHPSFVIYTHDKLNFNFSSYPAIKTDSNRNIMECGSVFFNSEKVLTFGYNLNILKTGKPNSFEISQLKSIDCTKVPGANSVVEHLASKFLYVPIEKTFQNIANIQYISSLDVIRNSGVYLIYGNDISEKLGSSGKPDCSIEIKFETSKLEYKVNLVNTEIIEKKLKIGSKEKNIKTFEIDISRRSKDNFDSIKKILCNISGVYTESDTEVKEKIKDYYSLRYKSVFVKLDYDGIKESIPNNPQIVDLINKPFEIDSFDKFGLYQCHSINSTKNLDAPDTLKKEFDMFMILPKEGKGIIDKIYKPYKKDLIGKGTCHIKKQNFGFLENVLFDNNNFTISVGISQIEQNKNFEYNGKKDQVVYKGDIERQTKLVCIYKTNFNVKFTITKIFEYKTNTTSTIKLVNGNIIKTSDNTPIIVAAVIAVGMIGIAVVVAVVLLKKRRRRRKGRKLSKIKLTTISSTSKTASGISTSDSTEIKNFFKNKKKKSKNQEISNSESEASQDENKNFKGLSGSKEVLRFTTK